METPVSDNEILDGEKIASKFIETNALTGSDLLAIGSSDVENNISTHVNTYADAIESSDENENDLVPHLKAPHRTDEIKK